MAHTLSIYVKTKILEEKLKKQRARIEYGCVRTMRQHAEKKDLLVNDLVLLYVKTPSLHLACSDSMDTKFPEEARSLTTMTVLPEIKSNNCVRDKKHVELRQEQIDISIPKIRNSFEAPHVEVCGDLVYYTFDKHAVPVLWKKTKVDEKMKLLLRRSNNITKTLQQCGGKTSKLHNFDKLAPGVSFTGRRFTDSLSRPDFSRLGREMSNIETRPVDKNPQAQLSRLSQDRNPGVLDGPLLIQWCMWGRYSGSRDISSVRHLAIHRKFSSFTTDL